MNAPFIGKIEIPSLSKLTDSAARELDRGRQTLADATRTAYLASLGVAATAQQETRSAVDSLVSTSGRTLTTLTERGERVDARRAEKQAELVNAAETRRDRALGVIDRRVVRPASKATRYVVQSVGMPTRDEVHSLAASVNALTRKVDRLVAQLDEMPVVAQEPTITVTASDAGWDVEVEGAANALASFATKDEAVDAARSLAAERAPSHLIVYKKDGTIQDKSSYHA